jgi:nicotinate-nucleotide adenylyltransferase
VVPSFVRSDKKSLQTAFLKRIAMLELALKGLSLFEQNKIKILQIEKEYPQGLSTYDLLTKLKLKHPDYEFLFVIGSDLLEKISLWDSPGVKDAGTRLIKDFGFLVLPRKGYKISSLEKNFVEVKTKTTSSISSSEVRKKVLAGESVENLLDPEVISYIKRKKLFSR